MATINELISRATPQHEWPVAMSPFQSGGVIGAAALATVAFITYLMPEIVMELSMFAPIGGEAAIILYEMIYEMPWLGVVGWVLLAGQLAVVSKQTKMLSEAGRTDKFNALTFCINVLIYSVPLIIVLAVLSAYLLALVGLCFFLFGVTKGALKAQKGGGRR